MALARCINILSIFETIQLGPFPIPAPSLNKLLLNLPVCRVPYTISLVIYEATFSLVDDLPCRSLYNSNVPSRFESLVKNLPHGWSDRGRLRGRAGCKTRKILQSNPSLNPLAYLALGCYSVYHIIFMTAIFKCKTFVCHFNPNRMVGMFCEKYCQPTYNNLKYSQKYEIQALDSGPNDCNFFFFKLAP